MHACNYALNVRSRLSVAYVVCSSWDRPKPQCVDYLLRKGARLEITDKNDVSTIMVASGGGHASCLSQILAAVKDKRILDATDAYGNNATHYACLSGESRALAILAEAGASLDIPSGPSKVGNAMHPAHIAVAYGFLSCLAELAKCSTNLEARDGSGETVLSLAIRCGSKSCVEFLLSGDSHRGALVKPDLPGKGAELPLHVAASLGRLSLVSLLLGAGAKPTARDGAGETALHVAARFGHAETVSALLEACEHDGSEGYTGTGPRRRSIARWWSMMTNSGETATFLAAREGFLGVCRALASAGALDPSFANSEGVTPIMVATLAGHEEAGTEIVQSGSLLEFPYLCSLCGTRMTRLFLEVYVHYGTHVQFNASFPALVLIIVCDVTLLQ